MPLSRRVPKFGFTNIFAAIPAQIVNLKDLNRFEEGAVIDAEALAAAGLVRRADHPVKVLSEGELTVRLSLKVNAVSATARTKVETAGGSIEILDRRRRKAEVPGQ
jgi:large subunit ribosomal protein L15